MPWIDRIFCRHFKSIMRITTDIGLYRSDSMFWRPYDECEVGFFDFMVMDEFLEFPHCRIIFGDENQSACLLVETMDDTWTIFSDFSVKSLYLGNYLIHQCTFFACWTGCRMRVDSSLFVNYHKIVIFKDDIKWSKIRFK